MAECHTPDAKMRVLPSPPVSPWMNKRGKEGTDGHAPDTTITATTEHQKDPILFEGRDSFETDDQPLFPADASKSTEDLITKHMTMHLTQFKNKLNQPTREEYRLALTFFPTIGAQYNRNPGAYMKRQREEAEDEYWQVKRLCARPGTKAAPVAIAPAPRPAKRAIKPVTPKANMSRVKRTPKSSPMAKLMNYPAKGRSETPDRVTGTKREDVDYASLPDYAPPTTTLPSNPKILKADWGNNNNPLDLSHDPHRHMLHEAEVILAGSLRLTCATYLCSKKRIFEARLNALRIGKEFRKTDAQQACKIDVNKASKLWTAFEKVGWFDKKFFQQYS